MSDQTTSRRRAASGASAAGGAGVQRPSLSVAFILLPEFTLMAFTGFVEALRHAADEADRSRQIRCRWVVVGPDKHPVKASCGVEVIPWEAFGDPGQFDYLVVVGGLLRAHSQINPAIDQYLIRAARSGTTLAGVCTGSFVLARAGLLEGRRCCVSHYHIDDFNSEFPALNAQADTLFAIDRGRITCAGGGAAIDLAIHLVEKHCGRELALKCISQMVIEQARQQNHPQAHIGASRYSHITDPLVRRAFLYVLVNVNRQILVRDMARAFNVGMRQLERIFHAELGVSPAAFIRTMRVEHGQWLLQHTQKTITQIAFDCGFADASHFSRACQRVIGKSPRAIRANGHLTGAPD